MLKKVMKWIGIVLGGLIGLLVVVGGVLYQAGTSKLNKKYDVSVQGVSVPADAQAVERGKHLATILVCFRCHTEELSGQIYFEMPGVVSIPTPNLTNGAGGVGGEYTAEDWTRAIRHGVGKDGRALFLMPSKAYNYLSDEDLGAIIAYIQSLPPVDNSLPKLRFEMMGRLMMGAGMAPPLAAEQIEHNTPPPPAPEQGVTAAYGEYLSHTCAECHGADLNGAPYGPPGQQVPAPNLTPGGELGGWSEEDFIKALRTGITPSGRNLNGEMPWTYYRQMTDDELKALWMFLQSLPVLEQGG